MKVQFLLVPYDSGRREWRMGRGPSYLLKHGVGSGIRALGHEVDAEYVEPGGVHDANPPASTEIATTFSLYRELANRARDARANGALPIALGGNCGVTLGMMASLVPARRIMTSAEDDEGFRELDEVGVLWLDAHADFNTPETTQSGFLDGMSLAILTGRCWYALSRSIPGFRPMDERNVVLAGIRDLDPSETDLVRDSELTVAKGKEARPTQLPERIADALRQLRSRVGQLHVHLDVDVLDDTVARGNAFAAPFGLTSDELAEVARLAASEFTVVSASVTAYDPAIDTAGAIPPAIARAVEALLTR
jgi:arginase